MKVINFFGQPSAGKSTTAAGLFHLMKLAGIKCELVGEYAKDMCWRGMPMKAFEDQLYILAKQHSRIDRLKGSVDYVITDSPILNSKVYAPKDYFPSFSWLVDEIHDSYENINIFVERVKKYDPVGRNQSEEGSDAIALKVKETIKDLDFISVKGDSLAPQEIMDHILN